MLIHLSLISHYHIYTCISFFLSYITCCIVFHESNSKAAALVLRPQCTCSRCPTLALLRTSCKRGSIKENTAHTQKQQNHIVMLKYIYSVIKCPSHRSTVHKFFALSIFLFFLSFSHSTHKNPNVYYTSSIYIII